MLLPIAILTAAFGVTFQKAYCKDIVILEKEAPETLLQTKIGNADVSLFATGSWTALVTGSFGLGFDLTRKISFSRVFPGMNPGIYFNQKPDLTLSLEIMKRFFFETSFSEEFKDSTFLLGYNGFEGEFLQNVRLGNTDIGISQYSFLKFPESQKNSIGASAEFATSKSRHEVMVRFDPSEKQKKVFIGDREIREEIIQLGAYITGRFFLLPDAGVENLDILLEAGNGPIPGSDNRFYRKITPDDAVVSTNDGWIFFKKECTGRVLVYYTKNGVPVGDDSLGKGFLSGVSADKLDPASTPVDFNWALTAYLGQDMEARKIFTNGSNYLLLWEKGRFSPFELLNQYKIEEDIANADVQTRIILVNKGNLAFRQSEVTAEIAADDNRLAVYALSGGLRLTANRYPFADQYPFLYGPDRRIEPGYVDQEILLEIMKPPGEYYLTTDVIPGSVRIQRNGFTETAYTIDYQTGKIEFSGYIHPEDRLEVLYRTSTKARGGDLLMGIGNHFVVTPFLALDAAAGLRWNIFSGGYSTILGENNGSITTTAGLEYKKEYQKSKLSVRLDSGLAFTTPDTTGTFRIFGMEEDGLVVSITGDVITPASPPLTPVDGKNLTKLNRGILYYKDYHRYSVLGGSQLMSYTWQEALSYPYENGSKTGPYTASAAEEGISGEIMVLDYAMTQSKSWVGAQIPIMKNQPPPDLSNMTSISFSWKSLNSTGDIAVILQIGAIDEDLDGDGVLDAETSEYSAGFNFDDIANGAVVLLGGGSAGKGNRRKDTEDTDNNGVLDRENPELIYEKNLALPGGEWRREELFINLTSLERQKLRSVSAIRIIVVNTSPGESAGKILIGGFSIAGTSFKTDTSPSGSITAREIVEAEAVPQSPEHLELHYREVSAVFHPNKEVQKVLEIQWGSPDPVTESWNVTGFTNPVPLSEYKELNFYLRTPSVEKPETAVFSLSITGLDGKGIICSFPLWVSETWRKVTIDLKAAKAYTDTTPLPGSVVSIEPTSGTLSDFTISLAGSPAGILYIDEIHLSQAFISVNAGARVELNYSIPGPIVSIKNIPVLGNVSLKEHATVSSSGFNAYDGDEVGTYIVSSLSEAEGEILFTRLYINFGVIYDGLKPYLSGGHRLQIPARPWLITFIDGYSLQQKNAANEFSRDNSLLISLPSAAALRLDNKAALITDTLSQEWKLQCNSLFLIPLSVSLNLDLGNSVSGYSTGEMFYFTRWITGYRLLLPLKTDIYSARRASADWTAALSTTPAGVTLKAAAGYKNKGTFDRFQIDEGSLQILFPLVFLKDSPAEWNIVPGYKRSFSNTIATGAGGDYGTDITLFWNTFTRGSYFYTSPPLAELFLAKTEQTFLELSRDFQTAEYIPEVSIDFARALGSHIAGFRLTDLFLPSSVKVSFGKQMKREAALVENRLFLSTTARFRALNLFGKFGIYPIFRFYDSEELTTAVEFGLEYITSTGEIERKLIVQHYVALNGRNFARFTLENRLSLEKDGGKPFSDTSKISFQWRTPFRPAFKLPPVRKDIILKTHFLHTESLEILIEPYNNGETGTGFSLLPKHETGLIFGDNGFLKAHAAVGFDRTTPNLVILGIQAGLEAKLSF
ncbi:MAG: hypothetical protein AB1798_08600 [Spirochaetota bacterium]